ncbi:MAG: PINc/VapC family ATPase [Candidatus Bipolaricaulota bacterium]|nr:PINc/VapC family ATPase [Candidatus Bipolaricaulota bacterium]
MSETNKAERYVLDTSVIVDGRITEGIRQNRFPNAVFIVPNAVLALLEARAVRGQETGYAGLSELKRLQQLAWEGQIELVFKGDRPRFDPLRLEETGELHAMVRAVAEEENAVLLTSSRSQALVSEAQGLPMQFLGATTDSRGLEQLSIMQFFDDQTMSVHLRAKTRPRAKRGAPGRMKVIALRDEPMTEKELERIAREIVEVAKGHPEGFIEMDAGGSTVVQLKNLRIAIARPPFSDALEITVVRPVVHKKLDEYRYADLLKERLRERSRGVLVSGAPGAGKSTFVQGIAEYLQESGWILKTMEKPRDLELSEDITQYTALNGEMKKTADVLLLVRPDYTIFDEMRVDEDFEVFADMRLAGVGMIGVVHATRGIDAVQRLIGRVDLGMIPQVVDTVVFIEDGDVKEIYEVEFTVKVPSGMGDTDLARPVIEIREFESKALVYEIYSFGEQVVVMPVKEVVSEKPVWRLATQALEYELRRVIRGPFTVEIRSDNQATLYVDEEQIPMILGRGGSRIRELEAELGIGLDVRSYDEMEMTLHQDIDIEVSDRHVILDLDPSLRGRNIEILVDGEPVFIGSVSRTGSIKLVRGSEPAERIYEAHKSGGMIRVRRAG